MKKIVILSFAAVLLAFFPAKAEKIELFSPDGKIKLTVEINEGIFYSVSYNSELLLEKCPVSMTLNQTTVLGESPKLRKKRERSVSEKITAVVPHKRRTIQDVYNELTLHFKKDFALIFRAYDDGVAYRFSTKMKGEIQVDSEVVQFNFAKNDSVFFPTEESFMTHSERIYEHLDLASIPENKMASLPLFVKRSKAPNLLITEADLLDYPGLYLCGSGNETPSLKARFPQFPLREKLDKDRNMKVEKRADYIAKTAGERQFPWRVVIIGQNDGVFVNTDMVFKLATPNRLDETDWIQPGKVAWDWWNNWNIYGVDFESGINNQTYKYYIDFAAQYGIEYIILDEGWSDTQDLLKVVETIDMEELMAYAKSKNVGIVLWVLSVALDKQMDQALARFEQWGAKGIKVDFMQRDDQKMVNFYERTARKAAKHKLLVDFHGSYKPCGLRRTYPNVLTREGVKGLENNKWSELPDPEHNLHLPFIRMVAGPMDYTPGAMGNARKANFKISWDRPMSLGTRCHQLAMYVVFESPLQMLSDNPSNYYREPETMQFLSKVPVVWDETLPLACQIGDYVTVARKSGKQWFVGGMTDWNARETSFLLSFLDKNKTYIAEIYQDGINAEKHASDFKRLEKKVTSTDKLTLKMAKGGGFAVRFYPE